tara:strand:+ start:126 stop:407 length:282 start_codon:yes stop_codon:yes gene_type:complete
MTKIYEVTRSYTTSDVYVVKANSEEEAKKKVVVLGGYSTHNSYDSDYDDEVLVWEVTDDQHDYCTECDCVLRWDESEVVCKSCEERIEKEQQP